MKKTLILIFVAFLLIFSVSALEIKTSKIEFMQGETFQATLAGNILKTIQKTDVGFYIDNVQQPITFDIAKINNTYYIYGILPYSSGNYTLKLSKVIFKEQNQIQTQDLKKNFIIDNSTAEFYVKPGFIVTTSNFNLILHNNKDIGLAIVANIKNEAFTAMIPPQEDKELKINIDYIENTTFTEIDISSGSFSYQLPAYIIKNQTKSNYSYPIYRGRPKLDFILNYINETLITGDSIQQSIELVNKGDKDTGPVNISVSSQLNKFINISNYEFSTIKSGEIVIINFTTKFPNSGNFTGFILANSANSTDLILLNFIIGTNVTRNSSIINQNTKSCQQLNGKLCASGEICSNYQEVSSDGFCCIGQCTNPNQSNSLGGGNWIFVIVIIIIIAIIGAFLFFKYKKPKASSSEVLKQKTKSFSERFETSGKLSKI